MKWRGSTAHIELISKLLKTLKAGKHPAILTILKHGLKVQTISPSQVCSAQIFLESSLFATYSTGDENSEKNLVTAISVSSLVNCLQMFSEWAPSEERFTKHPGCFFEYEHNEKFQLSFAYESMTSVCDLRLFSIDGTDHVKEIAFDRDNVALQVIMSGPTCANILGDLEAIAAKEVQFAVTMDPAQFEIRGVGDLSNTTFVLPNEPNVLDALVADQDISYTFAFENVAKSIDAIKLAKRVSMRFDESGTLSIQCLCEFEELSVYVEFRTLANY